jgi:endonuclease/exonuclease/phosphatase family metal-dependent hydrolase
MPCAAAAQGIFSFQSLSMRLPMFCLRTVLMVGLSVALGSVARADAPLAVRFATFNASMHRDAAGELVEDLRSADRLQIKRVAEIVQRVRPQVLLLNEFDYDADGQAADLFQQNYLAKGQNGQQPIEYPHRFTAQVNTGEPSGMDLDRDGRADGPNDAFGFGRFPGQYGMIVYSMFPIDLQSVRTFRRFLWKDMPGANTPLLPDSGEPYYSPDMWKTLRLSSKSFWDLPVSVNGQTVHLLASHPTPPVFDGPEDRNGRRNHDEIRLVADYTDPSRSGYLIDDDMRRGGLAEHAHFVIAGDLNADPHDGDSLKNAASQLTDHSLVHRGMTPASKGALEHAQRRPGFNAVHRGDPAHDTADFGRAGNLRVDYILPSRTLDVVASGVFWPASDEPGADLVRSSDHRMVWVDVRLKQ